MCNFILPGKLFACHDFPSIYAANGNFNSSHFQEIARTLFPSLPKDYFPVFLYPPSAAMFFSLLSFFKFDDSFIVWKLLSLASGIIAIYALVKYSAQPPKDAWLLMLYLPALFSGIETIVIGQTALVFNLLPLIVGHIFWKKEKNFWAGISWSFLSLKPQSMIIILPILCLAAFTANKKGIRSLLMGLAIGILTVTMTAVAFSNFSLLNNWLVTVKAWQQYIASGQNFKQGAVGVVSLAGMLTLNAPQQLRQLVAQTTSVCALAFLIWEFYVLNRIGKNATITVPDSKDLMLSIAVLFCPLISLYVTEVDLCLFMIPFSLSFIHKQDNKPIWSYLFYITLIFGLLVRLHQIMNPLSPNIDVLLGIGFIVFLGISVIALLRPLKAS